MFPAITIPIFTFKQFHKAKSSRMRLANKKMVKGLVVNILSPSFDQNESFNSIVKRDKNHKARIVKVVKYFSDARFDAGAIFSSDDDTAFAIMNFPNLKKTAQ